MDDRVKRFLLIDWKLGAASTDAEFQSEFAKHLLSMDCIGPQNADYKYRVVTEKVDQNCTQNCQLRSRTIAANRTGCLAVLGCNAGTCSSDDPDCKATCINSPRPNFCGYCTHNGAQCFEMSDFAGCQQPDGKNLATCNALGGTWHSISRICTLNVTAALGQTDEQACFNADPGKCKVKEITHDTLGRQLIKCRGHCYFNTLNTEESCCKDCCCMQTNGTGTCNVTSSVAQCVCQHKPECCNGTWGLHCVEAVNIHKCGFCTPPYFGFARYWDSQSDRCMINTDREDYCKDVFTQFGAVWASGLIWRKGRYNTKETCEQGYCKSDFTLDASQCASSHVCTKPCQGCGNPKYKSTCWTANMTLCNTLTVSSPRFYGIDGNADRPPMCYNLVLNKAECKAIDPSLNFQRCSDMNYDQCASCSKAKQNCPGFLYWLECSLQDQTTCVNENDCITKGGQCDDTEIGKLGACYRPHDINDNTGLPTCPLPLKLLKIGCQNTTVTSQLECDKIAQHGYHWLSRSYNETMCARTGNSCKLPSFATPSLPLGSNPSRCLDCSGEIQPVYSWEKGAWLTGQMRPLDWLPRQWGSVNHWNHTMNETAVDSVVSRAVAFYFASSFQTESLCSYTRIYNTLSNLACDCSGGPGAKERKCYGTNSLIPVGVIKACYRIASTQTTGPVQVTTTKFTIPSSVDCTNIVVSVIYASTFTVTKTTYLSSGLLPAFSQKYNPYGVIKNQFGVVVGQLDSDGFSLGFSTTLNDTLTVCIQHKGDIGIDSKSFPIKDFAIASADYKTFTPLDQTPNVQGSKYCINVQSSGHTYFLINRLKDWKNARKPANNVFSEEDIIAIYVTSALYLLMAAIAITKLVFMCTTSRIVENRLQKIFHVLCFMFCLNRGIYFVVLPSGIQSGDPILFYFLYEFSTFLFFSTYTCLVFFWADTLHFATAGFHRRSVGFMGRLGKVSIVANLCMYVIWILMLALYHTLISLREDIESAYTIFVGTLSLLIAGGFLIYGTRLQILTNKMSAVTKSSRKKMSKVTLIAIVCTLGFLCHCVFNILVAIYGTFLPPLYAVLFYVLTEITPCCCLLFLLRSKITRKNTKVHKMYSKFTSSRDSHSHSMLDERSQSLLDRDSYAEDE
eukprot:TRINITY_DN875_c1_g1_i12.p1 TRINITY_DN875_c1_g1~~TRINITY_DN875_c1_g1_i12.p1  ORF type:complete len:1129 (+),score=248.23 TRINITY_DN875_c1_g1_i12:1659-5045(+)